MPDRTDERSERAWRPELAFLAGLTALWWLAVLLVDPRGDFPLNDDWGYGPAVRALVEEGRLAFTSWQSMPLLSHVLFGALFGLPAGFSYTAVRFATLTAGWLGVLALYALLRQLGAARPVAATGAAAMALTPLYFGLAHTFMTDVTFVAALVGGTAAWVRATARDSWGWRAAAVGLAIVATLDRQLGVALPIGWTIVEALRLGVGARWLARALLPALLVIGVLVVYERAVDATIGLPALYHEKTRELGAALSALLRLRGLRYPLERTGIVLAYLGLFCAPLSLLVWRALPRSRLTRWAPLVGAIAGAAAAIAGRGMPLTGNVWIDFGIGPRSAPGVVEPAPPIVWALISAASGAGAVALVIAIARAAVRAGIVARVPLRGLPRRVWDGLRGRADGEAPSFAWLLLVLVPLIAFAPTAIAYGAFFDRYVLSMLPFALALIVMAVEPRTLPAGGVRASGIALGLMLAFSVPATHDYLAWQRARWEAVARVEARGIDRDRIHGGFEVDNAEPSGERVLVDRAKAPWVVATSGLPGYAKIETLPVEAWLPWSVHAIHVLRRDDVK